MRIAEQIKNLSEEIIASYKNRLKGNEELVKEVQKTMNGFRKDHLEMAATLRSNAATLHANIAKGQKERLKSFDTTMTGIRKEVKDIQISTSDLLKAFTVSHHEMAGELSEMLAKVKPEKAKWNTDRLKKFEIQMKGIQDEVANIFDETDKLLKKCDKEHLEMSVELRAELKSNFTKMVEATKTLLSKMNKEHQEMAKTLRKDLSQNDAQRLKDFNVMFTGIQKRVVEIQKYVNILLNEFSTDRKQAAVTWVKMAEAIAAIKKSFEVAPVAKKHTPAPAKLVAKKEEAKKEIVVEKEIVMEAEVKTTQPIAEMPKMDKPQKELTLEAAPVVKKHTPASTKTVAKKEEASIEVVAKKEIVIEEEVKKAEPVVKKPMVAKPQIELTLEEKVLDYLNSHKKGVRVSDMEKPFSETRMRIGFVSKKLLDDGKVRKIDNLYYPLANK